MSHSYHPKFTFAKYHSNANDFIIVDVDQVERDFDWFCEQASNLCDRHRGIGADGIILVANKSDHVTMSVINSDGSVAKNCGNGLKCVAQWYFDRTENTRELIIKLFNIKYVAQKSGDKININMGDGCLSFVEQKILSKNITAKIYKFTMGNEHLVFLLSQWPDEITKLHDQVVSMFDDITNQNINYVFKNNLGQVTSVVCERGVGFTQSCASGACASASAVWFDEKLLNLENNIKICQPGGIVEVSGIISQDEQNQVQCRLNQQGQAVLVFFGAYT